MGTLLVCFSPLLMPTYSTQTHRRRLMHIEIIDTPSVGDGTGSSGEQRTEELKGKIPELDEREKVEQGKA